MNAKMQQLQANAEQAHRDLVSIFEKIHKDQRFPTDAEGEEIQRLVLLKNRLTAEAFQIAAAQKVEV